MEKRFEKHRRFLVDRIDPDFGLLDKLLASDTLTREDVHKIKLINNTTEDKNRILLDVILKDKKANDLVSALRDSGQPHLANYINADGGYVRAFGDDWPLSTTDIKRLDTNRENLIDLLDTSDLCNRLFSEKVINNRQKQFILTKPTDAEKNEALLDMPIKFSIRQYNKSIACLRDSNQSHIADLFSEGGVLIRVHANLEVENANVEELEDEIISNLTRPLGNLSLDEGTRLLELAKQRFIAAKKGHSIVLYIHCKTPDELLQLIDLLKTNKLKEIVERVFIPLLSTGEPLRVSLTSSSEEFKRASIYFDSYDVSSSGNLHTTPTITERVSFSTTLIENCGEGGRMREISSRPIPIGCDASTQTDEESSMKNKTDQMGHNSSMECSICYEVLSNPRILSCGHGFCAQCLQTLVDNFDPILIWLFRGFPCPLCGTQVRLPDEIAQAFPRYAEMPDELANIRIEEVDSNDEAQGLPRPIEEVNRPANRRVAPKEKFYYLALLGLVIAFIVYTCVQYASPSALAEVVPTIVVAQAGTVARFNCTSTNQEPVYWRTIPCGSVAENEISIGEDAMVGDYGRSERFSVEIDSTLRRHDLVIKDIKQSDGGVYICIAGRDFGNKASAELVVWDTLTCQMSQGSYMGDNVFGLHPDVINITCRMNYKGNIRPYFMWAVCGRELNGTQGTYSGIASSELTLVATSKLDGTTVTCEAVIRDNSSEVTRTGVLWTSDTINVKYAVLTKEIVKECPGVENILKCNPSCSYRLETANNRQGCLVSYSTGTDVKLFYAHKSTVVLDLTIAGMATLGIIALAHLAVEYFTKELRGKIATRLKNTEKKLLSIYE